MKSRLSLESMRHTLGLGRHTISIDRIRALCLRIRMNCLVSYAFDSNTYNLFITRGDKVDAVCHAVPKTEIKKVVWL